MAAITGQLDGPDQKQQAIEATASRELRTSDKTALDFLAEMAAELAAMNKKLDLIVEEL